MADLPITSDQGATPVVVNDPTTAANVANVKAASTAAGTGDSSLVVALSPNSPLPTGTNKIGVTGVAQASTTSGQNGDLVQGAATTSAPTYVNAQTSPLSLNLVGGLRVDDSATQWPQTAAITQVSVSTVSTLLLAARAARQQVIIFVPNSTTYISYVSPASATNFTWIVTTNNTTIEVTDYAGPIYAIKPAGGAVTLTITDI